MKPKKKKLGVKTLKKNLWRLFSKFTRARDGYVCITCGKDMKEDKSSCHAGHYFPRTQGNALFFDERNVHAQCTSCNSFKSGNLAIYALKLEELYGVGILQKLDRIRQTVKKFTAPELEDMIKDYTQRLKDMGVL